MAEALSVKDEVARTEIHALREQVGDQISELRRSTDQVWSEVACIRQTLLERVPPWVAWTFAGSGMLIGALAAILAQYWPHTH